MLLVEEPPPVELDVGAGVEEDVAWPTDVTPGEPVEVGAVTLVVVP